MLLFQEYFLQNESFPVSCVKEEENSDGDVTIWGHESELQEVNHIDLSPVQQWPGRLQNSLPYTPVNSDGKSYPPPDIDYEELEKHLEPLPSDPSDGFHESDPDYTVKQKPKRSVKKRQRKEDKSPAKIKGQRIDGGSKRRKKILKEKPNAPNDKPEIPVSGNGRQKDGENMEKNLKKMPEKHSTMESPEKSKKDKDSLKQCPECPYKTTRYSDYRRHCIGHMGIKPHPCPQCDYSAATKQHLNYHMLKHTGQKPHKCQECGFATTGYSSLKRHMLLHQESRPFKCDKCSYASKDASSLNKHYRVHLDLTSLPEIPNGGGLVVESGQMKLTLHKCSECDYVAGTATHLKYHMMKHTGEKPYKCEEPGCDFATTGSTSLKRHLMIHQGLKPYQCDQCTYAARDLYALKKHLRIHSGEKNFKCDLCDYTAIDMTAINRHKRGHTGEKPHKCPICDFSTAWYNSLLSHIALHTGEKKYKCTHCDYATCQSTALRRHVRIHTGERPYKCIQPDCDRAFTTKYQYECHLYEHTGQKPFMCSYCGFTTCHSDSLKRHMLRHSEEKPFQCTECDFKANMKIKITKHMAVHNDDNLSVCHICKKSFTHYASLHKHMASHEDYKPYKCKVEDCNFACLRAKELKKHRLEEHPKESVNEEEEIDSDEDIEEMIVCYICGTECDSKEQYEEHIAGHSDVKKVTPNVKLINGQTMLVCRYCKAYFAERPDYERHIYQHLKADANLNLDENKLSNEVQTPGNMPTPSTRNHANFDMLRHPYDENLVHKLGIDIASSPTNASMPRGGGVTSTCFLCQSVLPTKEAYEKHILKHYDDMKEAQEPSLDINNTPPLSLHAASIVCFICKSSFNSGSDYDQHMLIHKANPFEAKYQEKQNNEENRFNPEEQTAGAIDKEVNSNNPGIPRKNLYTSDENTAAVYSGSKDNIEKVGSENLEMDKMHENKISKDDVENTGDKTFESTGVNFHENTDSYRHDETVLVCLICEDLFKDQENYDRHMLTHNIYSNR